MLTRARQSLNKEQEKVHFERYCIESQFEILFFIELRVSHVLEYNLLK